MTKSYFKEKVSAEELEREEKTWERKYLANRDHFRAMARQALKALNAGETFEMIVENGRLTVR